MVGFTLTLQDRVAEMLAGVRWSFGFSTALSSVAAVYKIRVRLMSLAVIIRRFWSTTEHVSLVFLLAASHERH